MKVSCNKKCRRNLYKEYLIDKGTMSDSIENISSIKTQTTEKGTNIDPSELLPET